MPHDLDRILEVTALAPKAWREAVGIDAPPYPFWWFLHTRIGHLVREAGGPPLEVDARRPPHEKLDPDLPGFGGASRLLFPVYRRFRALRHRGPRGAAAPGSVLVMLPHRGWPKDHLPENNLHLGPVVRALGARGERMAFAWSTPHAAGVPGGVGWLGGYWDRAAGQAFREAEAVLRRRFADAAAPADLGFDVPEPKAAWFLRRLRTMVPTMAIHAGHLVAAARMLNAVQPRTVLLTMEGEPAMRALVASASALDIPTVAVQNCWISPTSTGYLFASPRRARDARVSVAMPDRFAAWGEWFGDLLTTRGAWGDRVEVTGAPRYDALLWMDRGEARRELRRRAGWGEEERVVLWMTQTHGIPPEETQRNIEAMARLLPAGGFRLAVKLHPVEPPEHPYGPLQALGAHVLESKDAVAAMAGADVVLVRHSTTAIEASLLRVPIVLLDLTRDKDVHVFARLGLGRPARDEAGLLAEIERAFAAEPGSPLRDPARARPFSDNADGGATARVIALVDAVREAHP